MFNMSPHNLQLLLRAKAIEARMMAMQMQSLYESSRKMYTTHDQTEFNNLAFELEELAREVSHELFD
jgi:hypothetical protein